MQEKASNKEYALEYVKRGMAIIPLKARAKTPIVSNWQDVGITDIEEINKHWNRSKDLNIGILTGAVNGIFVIDIDCGVDYETGLQKFGDDSLAEFESEYGELNETATQTTGSGGYQMFYRIPDGVTIHNGTNVGGYTHIDVRGQGGYVVAPPSTHPNGQRYEWQVGFEEIGIAYPNAAALKLARLQTEAKAKVDSVYGEAFILPEVITPGGRDDQLFRYAASMQAKGVPDDELLENLLQANFERCKPPLEEKEILKNIYYPVINKYEKGSKKTATEEKKEIVIEDTPNTSDMIEDFLNTIMSEKYKPIPTGFKVVDDVLKGGLIKQQLVTLSAAPGMGKTTLAQQLFENMAARGHKVLYFNLEMSREQMLARSLARIGTANLTSTQILQAYKLSEHDKTEVIHAADYYKKTIGQNIIYNPGNVGADLDAILAVLNKYANEAADKGEDAPLVCIDYLHLVRGSKYEDNVDTLKRAVEEFKDYAVKYNSIVLLIVANNRISNKAGKASMESGRDTSALEYSGDIMLALNYAMSDKARSKITADDVKDDIREFKENPANKNKPLPQQYREYSLRVIKTRFAEAEDRAIVELDGAHAKFIEKKTTTKNSQELPPGFEDLGQVKIDF